MTPKAIANAVTHTPGPWKVKQQPNGRWVVGVSAPLGGRGTVGKLSVLWEVGVGKPGHENTAEGNAHLIAAAPDLLEASKALLAFYGHLESPATFALEAAIAKAEGR